jgi:hypothetical protein
VKSLQENQKNLVRDNGCNKLLVFFIKKTVQLQIIAKLARDRSYKIRKLFVGFSEEIKRR